jgi:hypothetical protein
MPIGLFFGVVNPSWVGASGEPYVSFALPTSNLMFEQYKSVFEEAKNL